MYDKHFLIGEQVAMLSKIIEEAKKFKFYFVTVDDFSPCAPLSTAHFGKLKNTGVVKNVGALFSLDVTQLQGNPAVKRFMDSIGKIDVTSISAGPTEHMSFFTIADKLLTMLGHEVCLSSCYKSQCEESAKFKVGHMSIGSVDTLHGYPDAKIRAMGTSVHCLRPASRDSPSSSPSEGDCVYAEGKLTPAKFNKHQLIATAVVTSFIEHNRHADLNPFVPVIMMCVPKAMMCVYDCTQDVLLVSNPYDWIIYEDDEPTDIDKTGVFLLWIAIHHRYVNSYPRPSC